MASKKYSFLAGLLCLLSSYSFSQTTTTTTSGTTGGGYDVTDSSVISSRRLPQYTEFMNGTYNYPAKPRNQWELGIKLGTPNISGDVASIWPTIGAGIGIRKAFGYIFSLRLSYDYLITKGLNWLPSKNFYLNPAWTSNGYTPGTDQVFYNYKTTIQDLALEGIFSLNNIRFHKSKTGVNFYAIAGVAGMIYDARVNALGSDGKPYNFNSIAGGTWKTRKQVRDAIKALPNWDNTYETPAQNHGDRRPKLFGQTFKPIVDFGFGVAFKLSNKINLSLEDRMFITKDDLLDGQQWAEQTPGNPVLTGDYDTYNFASIGLNFNLGSKAVQPLWWLNPLDYAYQEIRKPRLMILPKPVLPDADGDGITDQFDQEVTPAGCPVDSHGVSLDTDGDGVPDCKDKEKITPTYCQPVDADGVGKCPCPDSSCFKGYIKGDECATILGQLPSINFSGNGYSLTNDAKGLLASVAARLRNSPTCRIVVTGYCSSTKAEQQRSWDRVNAVINYLVEKEGISQDRMIFNYGQNGGDCNTIDLRAAAPDEQGQTTVPAPHPNLSRGRK